MTSKNLLKQVTASLIATAAFASSTAVTAEPVVRIGTNLGDLFITLTPQTTPVTVTNFRNYVQSGAYNDALFHFSQPASTGVEGVLHTGRFIWPEGDGASDAFEDSPIIDEPGQSNTRGSVGMLRDNDQPNTATNGWFINTSDNAGTAPNGFDFLNGGVTVFGYLNDRSLALVDEIAALDIQDRGNNFENLPVIGDPGATIERSETVLILDTAEFESISDPVAAVLPGSRTVPVGFTATAFATILNTDTENGAASCRISAPASLNAVFEYQLTDPVTNEPVGVLNPLVDVPAGGAATFIFAITPAENIESTELALSFNCGNAANDAVSIAGVNTLTLSVPPGLSSDVVAIARTQGNNAINDIPTSVGSGAFAVATVNLGDSEVITVSADDGDAELPVAFFVCETNPTTGLCFGTPSASVEGVMNFEDTRTFAIFAQLTDSAATIDFSPADTRAFVRFRNPAGELRGSTSVALRTQ